jgi:hypothetical protein
MKRTNSHKDFVKIILDFINEGLKKVVWGLARSRRFCNPERTDILN